MCQQQQLHTRSRLLPPPRHSAELAEQLGMHVLTAGTLPCLQ